MEFVPMSHDAQGMSRHANDFERAFELVVAAPAREGRLDSCEILEVKSVQHFGGKRAAKAFIAAALRMQWPAAAAQHAQPDEPDVQIGDVDDLVTRAAHPLVTSTS
ncbi:MAG TPA: hypothetical protein VF457_09205 [Burkholderiaceae bacterium]